MVTYNTYLPAGNIGQTVRRFLVGGVRRWWFVPRRFVAGWPAILPGTQMLANAPELLATGEWFGPVLVTSQNHGLKETMERTKAGPVWKIEISGVVPGIGTHNHINLGNLVHDQFAVIAQPRNTNVFLVLGGPNSWLRLGVEFSTGENRGQAPGSIISMTVMCKHRSLLLAGFSGGNEYGNLPDCGPDGTGGSTFLGLRTFLYMVNTDDVDNKQTYLLLPDLQGTTMEGVERSGMENLQILTDGSAPAYTYQVAWDSAAARLDVHPDRPIAPGENFFFLFR